VILSGSEICGEEIKTFNPSFDMKFVGLVLLSLPFLAALFCLLLELNGRKPQDFVKEILGQSLYGDKIAHS